MHRLDDGPVCMTTIGRLDAIHDGNKNVDDDSRKEDKCTSFTLHCGETSDTSHGGVDDVNVAKVGVTIKR